MVLSSPWLLGCCDIGRDSDCEGAVTPVVSMLIMGESTFVGGRFMYRLLGWDFLLMHG